MTDQREVRQSRGWHIEKGISISHIVTLLVFCGGALAIVNAFDKRVTILEIRSEQQGATDRRQDDQLTAFALAVRNDIHDLSIKLDRLIERGQK